MEHNTIELIQKEFIHELLNSINSLRGINNLLELNIHEALNMKEYLSMNTNVFNYVENITKEYNLLQTTGKQYFKYVVFDADEEIHKITKEYEHMSNVFNININSVLRKIKIYTDQTQFRTVISNLLSNAIKYNTKNGNINIECYTIKSGTKIAIYDTGIGMTDDELKKIGIPFYRCKRINCDGSGLGITLVKKICNLLNWEFNISSKINIGTRITIVIPRYKK